MKSVFVYGPGGCGKTTNRELLRKHFGLRHVLDGWSLGDDIPAEDTLILTCVTPSKTTYPAHSYFDVMGAIERGAQ